MVPFEPKTDSKEFEVPNAALNTSAGRRTSETADLTIRIWRRDAGTASASATWNSDSVLVYMIADLVAASHGQTATEAAAAMVAHFDSSFQALVAAKRIQTAILEFLACRSGDYVGAAVLIHQPLGPGFSQGMAQSALRLAEPGQIILADEVSRRFQDLPGIELRAVSALTTGGTEHAGFSELIWTTQERLASLRSSASLAPPTVNIASSVGATMIVNAPVAPRKDPAPTASGEPHIERGASRDGAFEQGLAEFEERQSFITKSRLVVGAILVVLLIVGFVLFHPWSSSDVRVKPKSQSPAVEAPPVTNEPPAVVPQPPPLVQPVPESHAKPQRPAPKPPIANKPPVEKPVTVTVKEQDKPRKPEDAPIQGFEGNSTYDGMTQKDIPRLLQWARSDAGNGNYAKAAQEYRVILQLQPANPDAKEGLRKIQVAQGRDQ